jgi:hypothetical protein
MTKERKIKTLMIPIMTNKTMIKKINYKIKLNQKKEKEAQIFYLMD